MQTSAQGVAALEFEEGVVLRVYRDPVGILTIGAGLTATSGVVKPKPGMVITAAEASRLLQLALRRNYEPAVATAMPKAKQHEFDAGVVFHFNTGAIDRATWVKKWRAKAGRAAITARLIQWNKGGGKVLPGLVRRRAREADMLLDRKYPVPLPKPNRKEQDFMYATWALPMEGGERENVWNAFRDLGLPPGNSTTDILRSAVMAFQRQHDLTVDGIIGRATLSTLQREIDARRKAKVAAPAAVAAAPAAATDVADQISGLPYAGLIIGGLLALYAARIAWGYRDVIAARIYPTLPRVAAILRRF
jgi:lysozyme